MGSEYTGSHPDPNTQRRQPYSAQHFSSQEEQYREQQQAQKNNDEDTQRLPAAPTAPGVPVRPVSSAQANYVQHQEPAYREHVSGSLVVHPADAPYFRPAYVPYHMPTQPLPAAQLQQAGQPIQPAQQPAQQYSGYPAYPSNGQQNTQQPVAHGYQGYYPHQPYPNYPGYSPYYGNYGYPYPYPFVWRPPQPKRDGYLFGISIASFVGALLVLLGGLACTFILLLVAAFPTAGRLSGSQEFGAVVLFTALCVAGLFGGGFSLYHSIRSVFLKRPSTDFRLPWFWLFLLLYTGVVVIASAMRASHAAVTNIPLTIFLIALAGVLPALTILALTLRRLHFPRTVHWPTSWRRFTLAVVSGSTLAIVLASIFELILTAVLVQSLHISNIAIDNPNQPIPSDPKAILSIFVLVSVIAPLVEEAVKPLAVVVMIGRVRSAAEAFILGMSAGIGFDLIETSGYISQGYRDWIDVALQRSSAGLLHGLGAAMVALGWYYLTHPKESNHRFLLGFGCMVYAVLQHAIWNGSFVLQLLPAPIGPFFDTGTITLGTISFQAFLLVYVVETLLMLIFLWYVTSKIRGKRPTTPETQLASTMDDSRDERLPREMIHAQTTV